LKKRNLNNQKKRSSLKRRKQHRKIKWRNLSLLKNP
jgi:hypothetical protein